MRQSAAESDNGSEKRIVRDGCIGEAKGPKKSKRVSVKILNEV